jgi:hypothetical protein
MAVTWLCKAVDSLTLATEVGMFLSLPLRYGHGLELESDGGGSEPWLSRNIKELRAAFG